MNTGHNLRTRRRSDNLKCEGVIFFPEKPKAPIRGERVEIRVERDHLSSQGKFFGKKRSDYDYTKTEKQKPYRREDNLQLSNVPLESVTSKQSEFQNFKPEKCKPIIQSDNLKSEGRFLGQRNSDYKSFSFKIKTPISRKDNLQLSSEPFDAATTQRSQFVGHRPEMAKQIRYPDNLKTEEGEFTQRYRQPIPPMEKPLIRKNSENLKVEGDFLGRRNSDYREFPVDKQRPLKQEDHIQISNEPFDSATTQRSQFVNYKYEHQPPVKYFDNLKLEQGEFAKRDLQPIPKIDRVMPVKYPENLKSEGELFMERNSDYQQFNLDPHHQKKREDNIQLSTEPFEAVTTQRSQFANIRPEMAKRFYYSDNIKLEEGDFSQREYQPVHALEKVYPVRYSDNLKNEGDFYCERNSDFQNYNVERQRPAPHEDNIQMSTDTFDGITTQQSQYVNSRPQMRKPIHHSDNLTLEQGEFTKREILTVPFQEKVIPMKYTESLKMDGEFYGERNPDYNMKQYFTPEKQRPFDRKDNLHLSTEPFDAVTMKQSQFANFKPEKPELIIQRDNLQLEEGEFTKRELQPYPKLEKPVIVKYNDTLKMDGDFYGEKNQDFKQYAIEKQRSIRKEDNLHLSTEPFDAVTMKQTQFANFKPDKVERVIHKDNLKIDEGEFSRREYQHQPIPKYEKPIQVKYNDTLKLDGEFYGEKNQDFKQYTVEKQRSIRKEDNIHLSTEPFDAVTMKQTQFANFKPEKIERVIHKDNLKIDEGEFSRREYQPIPKYEKSIQVKYNDTLKMDGEFYGEKNQDFKQYTVEKQRSIRKEDNLQLSTEPFNAVTMKQSQFLNYTPERNEVVVHHDNLKVEEGEFAKREFQPMHVIENKLIQNKYPGSLKMDGEFYGVKNQDFKQYTVEKQRSIRKEDNIHLSNEPFDALTMKQTQFANFKPEKIERVIHRDNLKIDEGEFSKREYQPIPKYEKPVQVKYNDTLKLDGEFYGEKNPDYKFHTMEKQRSIRKEDNIGLSTEPFDAVTMQQSQFRNFKPERNEVVVHEDNLKLEEGEFTKRELQPFPKLEKPVIVKYGDTLKMDGEFYGERNPDFKFHTVEKQKGFRKEDNIRLNSGPFDAVTTKQSQFTNFKPERYEVVVHSDNLKLEEGEFTKREVQSFPKLEKPIIVKYNDTLKMDGDFYGERNPDYKQYIVEKQRSVHHEDNIQLSTEPFNAVTMKQSQFLNYTPERNEVVVHHDNLKVEEGEFAKREFQPVPVMENKLIQNKYPGSLKMDGEFYGERNQDFKQHTVEKQRAIRKEDNIHLSTEPFDAFTLKQTQFTNFKPEKIERVIHRDNLKVDEGEFSKREFQPIPKYEKPIQVKYNDTLKMDGEFYGEKNPDYKEYTVEKQKAIHHEDNIQLSTEPFNAATMNQSEFLNHTPQRNEVVIHQDNLKLEEGQFAQREFQPVPVIEKQIQKKYTENLKMDGEFYGERNPDYKEYSVVKQKPMRQETNIQLSNEPFDGLSTKQVEYTHFKPERAIPILQSDNLKIEEGEFAQREMQPIPKIEKALTHVKHPDGFKMDPEFYGERNPDYKEHKVDKQRPIRQEDNIHLSKERFDADSVKQIEFKGYKPELVPQIRQTDNLKTGEGEFTKRELQPFPRLEKVTPVFYSDSLKMDGEFFGKRNCDYGIFSVDKQKAMKHEDNIGLSSEPFDAVTTAQSQYLPFKPELTQPVRQSDNLRPEEGEFTKREVQSLPQYEKPAVVRHTETLKMEGDFYGERNSDYTEHSVEKQKPLKQENNLGLSTAPFNSVTMAQSQYLPFKPELTQSLRLSDNLKPGTGEFTKRQIPEQFIPIQKPIIVRSSENLKMDGEFFGERNSDYKEFTIEKQKPIKGKDNLHVSIDIPYNFVTMNQSQYTNFKPEVTQPIRYPDNIKIEDAEFTKRIVSPVKKIEKIFPVRRTESLKTEGKFYGERNSDYKAFQVEKQKAILQEDNITLSTEPFNPVSAKQKHFVHFKPEKAKPIVHSDNIKLQEGEFTKRHFEHMPYVNITKVVPFRHSDSLKTEGEFYGERNSDYQTYPAEKQTAFKFKDNLQISTEPFDFETTQHRQYIMFRPEKAQPIVYEDNLMPLQGSFSQRHVQTPFKVESRIIPVVQSDTLKVEGKFYGERNSDFKVFAIDRPKAIKREDNIHLSSEPFHAVTMNQSQFALHA